MLEKLFRKKEFKIIQDKKSIFDSWATVKNAQGFYGVIDRLPNPDIILKNAGKTISVLSNLENHYQVSACIESRKAGTLRCDWELKKGDCPDNKFKFFDEIFKSLNIYRLIEDILDAPMYGYVPIEISWEKQNSNILPIELEAKPQEWFFFNSEGDFFFKDKNFNGKKEIDLNGCKFLLPRNKPTFKNPYGKAKLSSAFWNVAFINGGMEFWVKFAEKYAMPYMFGKYDRQLSKDEQNQFLNALQNLVQDAIALIPSDGSVEIAQTGTSANSTIYSDLITKCENNISKAILGQTLTTDIGNSGSYAASNTHMGVREDIIASDKRLVENTINQFIQMINSLNFSQCRPSTNPQRIGLRRTLSDFTVPEFNFVGEEDLGTQKAQRDTIIAGLGVRFSKEYLMKTYGYQENDLDIIEDRSMDFNDDKNNIEIPQSDTYNLEDLKNPIDENVKKIIDFFNKSKDSEEALNRLEELYPELDSVELEKILTKIIFVAELQGRADAQAENEEFSAERNDGDVSNFQFDRSKGRLDVQNGK